GLAIPGDGRPKDQAVAGVEPGLWPAEVLHLRKGGSRVPEIGGMIIEEPAGKLPRGPAHKRKTRGKAGHSGRVLEAQGLAAPAGQGMRERFQVRGESRHHAAPRLPGADWIAKRRVLARERSFIGIVDGGEHSGAVGGARDGGGERILV